MRKSKIFETIYKEVDKIGKSNRYFTRTDIKNLISKHQKFSVFLYKHSDNKNEGKLTLFFIRGKKIKNLISFKINSNKLKKYKKINSIK